MIAKTQLGSDKGSPQETQPLISMKGPQQQNIYKVKQNGSPSVKEKISHLSQFTYSKNIEKEGNLIMDLNSKGLKLNSGSSKLQKFDRLSLSYPRYYSPSSLSRHDSLKPIRTQNSKTV